MTTIRDPLLGRLAARWSIIVAAALTAGTWVAVVAVPVPVGDSAVVAHYTTTFGIDALGSWSSLLRLPVTGTIILLVNTAVARLLAASSGIAERRAVDSILTATILLEFALLVGAILLLRMNRAIG